MAVRGVREAASGLGFLAGHRINGRAFAMMTDMVPAPWATGQRVVQHPLVFSAPGDAKSISSRGARIGTLAGSIERSFFDQCARRGVKRTAQDVGVSGHADMELERARLDNFRRALLEHQELVDFHHAMEDSVSSEEDDEEADPTWQP